MSEPGGFRCGHVAVLGRPNAGKSTLVNQLVGRKVAIVSAVPQTTRTTILGIRHEPGAQLIFVDTPGIHVPKHELNRRMVAEAYTALAAVDIAIHVIDAADRVGGGDSFVAKRIRDEGAPWIVALNKVDRVRPKERLLPLMQRFADEGAAAVVPISALDGRNLEGLLTEIRARLPEAPPTYPSDLTTDQTERFMVAELIRERVLEATREEVPHATTVLLDALEERTRPEGSTLLVVEASLVVEKENQKGILIGRGGQMLKRIGTAARAEIEERLGVSCHLGLFVKVVRRWREDRAVLSAVFSGNRGVRPDARSAEELLAELADEDD